MLSLRTNQKIAIARAAFRLLHVARKAVGKSDRLVARRSGIVWELDLAQGIDLSIYLFGTFEAGTARFYRRLISSGDVVIDIGANIGAHTLPFAKLVGDAGRVIAFEPTLWAFQKLKTNISLNPHISPRIEAVQAMLTAGENTAVAAEAYSSWPLQHGAALHPVHSGQLMSTSGAVSTTLDAAVSERVLPRLDFIKLDVEGNELEVLRGAQATLRRFRPRILMEFSPSIHSGTGFDHLINFLGALGGHASDVQTGAALTMDATSLKKKIQAGSSRNVLVRL